MSFNFNYFHDTLEMFRKEREQELSGEQEPPKDYVAKLNEWRREREDESCTLK